MEQRSTLVRERAASRSDAGAPVAGIDGPAPPPEPDGGPALKSVLVLNDHGWVNGGQAKMAIDSALQLKQRGLDVCFIAGTGPVDDRLIDAGVECHCVGDHDILSDPIRIRAASRGLWNIRAARVLGQCLAARDGRSTVIHVHGWAKALSPSIGPVITQSDAAHVYSLHEYFLACPNGGFYDYRSGQICTRRALGVDCLTTRCDPRSEAHKLWRIARQAVARTSGGMPADLREIIYLAPEQLSIMGSYMPAEARWHHLPNPVEPQPAGRVAAERNSTFLFIGRLSPEKGAVLAARAAKLAGVPIAFCGEGQSRDAVRRANPDAQMLGWLSKEELDDCMRRARCLVFPSLWYEGYPLVVADALRVGLPVIVSRNSNAASSVVDGIEGLHVRTGDPEALAEAMTRLGSDDLVRELATAAFAAGARLLDDDAYTSRLLAIYEKALARKHTAVPLERSIVP